MHPVLHLRGTVVPGFGRGSRELGERLQCRVDKAAGHPVCKCCASGIASPVELCSLLGRLPSRLLISIGCRLLQASPRQTWMQTRCGAPWQKQSQVRCRCMPCLALRAGWFRC